MLLPIALSVFGQLVTPVLSPSAPAPLPGWSWEGGFYQPGEIGSQFNFDALSPALTDGSKDPYLGTGREKKPWQFPNGTILDGDQVFESWSEYFRSKPVQDWRCGCNSEAHAGGVPQGLMGDSSDCSFFFTNPSADYDPSVASYEILCVVHVITDGPQGFLPDSCV